MKNRVVPSSASQDGLQVPNEKEKLELHEEESNEPLVVNVLSNEPFLLHLLCAEQ